jgi:hypothetical protein
MRSVSRFLVLVAMVMVAMVTIWITGCAVSPPAGTSEAASTPVGEVQQALTGCELDCPDGSVLTCGLPCSVPDANTLICNGVTSHCPPTCIPHGCNGGCGTIDDGCGGTLECGSCEPPSCRPPTIACCGGCFAPATCAKREQQGTCN